MKPIAVPDAFAPDVAEAVACALEELAGPHVSSAYLFGSHAAGRAHRESDVDVGVLVSWKLDRGQRFEERVRLAGALPGKVGGRPVDVVVLNDAPRTSAAGSSSTAEASSASIRSPTTPIGGTCSSGQPIWSRSSGGRAGSSRKPWRKDLPGRARYRRAGQARPAPAVPGDRSPNRNRLKPARRSQAAA